MTKFNARQFAKFGFVRDESQDFTDDGNRFRCWTYLGVRVSYTTGCGEVFIAPRFETYNKPFSYKEFLDAMNERGIDPDCYNGIENDRDLIDLGFLAEQIEATLQLIRELEEAYSKPEPISYAANERLVNEKAKLKDAIDFIEHLDWLHIELSSDGRIYKTWHTLNDIRKWYCSFETSLEKLEAIDKADAHLVNVRFDEFGYVEVRDRDYYLKCLEEVKKANIIK